MQRRILEFLALGTSAAASGGNVSQPGKISVLTDAIPREAGSPPHTGTPVEGG
jgi:putative transposase